MVIFCLPAASGLISPYLCSMGCYTAVELHSGNGPVSLWEFPRANGELRKGKGNQTVARIPSLKSDGPVL